MKKLKALSPNVPDYKVYKIEDPRVVGCAYVDEVIAVVSTLQNYAYPGKKELIGPHYAIVISRFDRPVKSEDCINVLDDFDMPDGFYEVDFPGDDRAFLCPVDPQYRNAFCEDGGA